MGKEERIWWKMWVMEQEKGCRESVLGLTGGEKCDDGGRKRLFRTAVLPVWRCRTYHIATWNGLFRKAKKPVRQRRKGDNKQQKSVKRCVTRHCVKSARIAYLRPEEARRTNTHPIRSWREYLFIAHPCVMHVYAFMLRCRHSYAAPFSAEGFGRTVNTWDSYNEITMPSSQTVPAQQFPHSSSRTIPSMATAL